jgi:hypothetical protein
MTTMWGDDCAPQDGTTDVRIARPFPALREKEIAIPAFREHL